MSILEIPDRIPFARWRPVPGWEVTGHYTDVENVKVVWHTTQGNGDPFEWYKISGGIPHLTIQRDGTIDQHYGLRWHSRALKNLWGGVQTNLDGAIQIELCGFAGVTKTPEQLAAMRRLNRWFTRQGIPARWIVGGAPTVEQYQNGTWVKLSGPEWDNGSGHVGHINVPENNHVDPQFTAPEVKAVEGGWRDVKTAPLRRRIRKLRRRLQNPGTSRPMRQRIRARIRRIREKIRLTV